MANFSDVAKSGWSTDDGSATFCVPMASVIHGFIYNKAAFDELGITPPATDRRVLRRPRQDQGGRHLHPALDGHQRPVGSRDHGLPERRPEPLEGRGRPPALIDGSQKLTDEAWVAPFAEIARWKDYLGDGFEAQTYPDSQNLFTLGRAAIYPAGSWEIAPFEAQIQGAFEMGAFPPPVAAAGDECYISDHVDIAIGMNAASPNADAAKAFLEWVGTPEFAQLYANALPGFFPLQEPVTLENPLSQEFVSWREKCASTIRSTYQILSRGTPNLENETWNASANVIRGTETPEAAAARLQEGLASWFEPHQN